MKIFILEDDENRIAGFIHAGQKHDLTIAKWLSGPEGAYEKYNPPYDLICLDHDLGGLQMVQSDGEDETGYDFTLFMVSKGWPADALYPQIVIHSYNPDGVRNMGMVLLHGGFGSEAVPFGPELLKAIADVQT